MLSNGSSLHRIRPSNLIHEIIVMCVRVVHMFLQRTIDQVTVINICISICHVEFHATRKMLDRSVDGSMMVYVGSNKPPLCKSEETQNVGERKNQPNIENIVPYVQERYCVTSNVPSPDILDEVSNELTHLSVQNWNTLLEKVELSEAQHILHSHSDKGVIFLQIYSQIKKCNWEHLIHILEEIGSTNAASILHTWYLNCQNDTDSLAESWVSRL